jgi:hypothetical protein
MADIVTSRVFVDGEKGITAAKLNDITASSVIQPAFYTSKPTAGTADPTDIALILKSGAYAQVPVSTLGGSATQAQIWSTRLRSFNAIGNPTFEVDQRNVANIVANPVSGTLVLDRWAYLHAGTNACSVGQVASNTLLPGTSFSVSRVNLRITLTTAQASLGTSDFINIIQTIEGPWMRELFSDVHSVSLLVRSSVANLNFGVYLRDNPPTKSLVKLCNIPSANTWTVISLPNIPVFPSGNFSMSPGAIGYQLGICLCSGTAITAPANDTWQTGSFVGAVGQSNFAASPVNSTFDIAFVQNEPGVVCSTFIDKPFTQNLDECLRYYAKSYPYGTAVGTTAFAGALGNFIAANATSLNGGLQWPKPLARNPTFIGVYNPGSGAVNTAYNGATGAATAVTVQYFNEKGLFQLTGTGFTVGVPYAIQYAADTGW